MNVPRTRSPSPLCVCLKLQSPDYGPADVDRTGLDGEGLRRVLRTCLLVLSSGQGRRAGYCTTHSCISDNLSLRKTPSVRGPPVPETAQLEASSGYRRAPSASDAPSRKAKKGQKYTTVRQSTVMQCTDTSQTSLYLSAAPCLCSTRADRSCPACPRSDPIGFAPCFT